MGFGDVYKRQEHGAFRPGSADILGIEFEHAQMIVLHVRTHASTHVQTQSFAIAFERLRIAHRVSRIALRVINDVHYSVCAYAYDIVSYIDSELSTSRAVNLNLIVL